MKVLSGSRALSDFRLGRLLSQLQEISPAVNQVNAFHQYFVDLDRGLSGSEETHLREILVESGKEAEALPDAELWIVTPRPGTVSPWSSKATDIVHNCGLQAVKRVERGIAYQVRSDSSLTDECREALSAALHDKMTETVFRAIDDVVVIFESHEPRDLQHVVLGADPIAALSAANQSLGLALSDDEIEYLADRYAALGRDPTDVELMMFAQANSEHCRHKIFNADWVIDGVEQSKTLFGMIKNTYKNYPTDTMTAYSDNSSVIRGFTAQKFAADPDTHVYGAKGENLHILMKVETHNHPTAISPFPGAATGSGGEIRDEGATGSGSAPKAGLNGFSVSNLQIPDFKQPWESSYGKPDRIVSALDIMVEGPIGAAAFNNEFGRPGLLGYFRTFEEKAPGTNVVRGYHKPIMIAGGVGSIRHAHLDKKELPVGTPVVVLGGPAMLIGLGGGAASSMTSGTSSEDLDFASVQRGNPEMQRRAQEVINHCTSMGESSPILSIHDIGAGGLSNGLPEIINDAGRGGEFQLRDIPNAEPGMSPMEIWCNEAQERYVLAIDAELLAKFESFCQRERCPYAVLGHATEALQLKVSDSLFDEVPVDMPLDTLLGKPPKMVRDVERIVPQSGCFDTSAIRLDDAIDRVLHMPSVASKQFLITIADRSVTGLVARDQMVGPWQVPVADVAVTATDYTGYTGEAMTMGERTPIAILNGPASGRMAVAESLLNIAAANIEKLADIKLSANWMAAAGHPGEEAALFDTVKAIGEELCPELDIAIPVGKDSLSMKTSWESEGKQREVVAPLSLIITAFAPVQDIRKTLTPRLKRNHGETELLFIDLANGKQRMGGSALAQAYKQVGSDTPDVEDAQTVKAFFDWIQGLNQESRLLAYHDRSDGGLFTTLVEMAFAGHVGLELNLGAIAGDDMIAKLFNEELGAVIQVQRDDVDLIREQLEGTPLENHVHSIGTINLDGEEISISQKRQMVYSGERTALHKAWAETSYRIQALRDNPDCADEEYAGIQKDDPGLRPHVVFNLDEDVTAPYINVATKPRVAVLREQGVNGHVEMAAAFDRSRFEAVDVHMTDIFNGSVDLADFKGLVACGGFSYGDVLGAGGGWAKSILHNAKVRDSFEAFFQREDIFALGVCNGCQMLSQLKHLIPGAEHWPFFRRNISEQFEARYSLVEILPSPSIFLSEMQGAHLPIAVAHGEGRAVFRGNTPEAVMNAGLVSMRYVDNHGHTTEKYPANPNGSPMGITGLTTTDGRFTIMMPHPERLFRTVQHSWHPDEWGENGPWLRMFQNARAWVD